MTFIKKNYGWMLVAILAIFPLFVIFKMINIDFSNGLSITLIEGAASEGKTTLEMLYHVSGEFAIRWMTAVLTCTPFFILFGANNLFVRQAMGIATAVWSFIHFILFLFAEGFLETFTELNYIAGFLAVLILIPLFFTSNRKSMKKMKSKWKKLQSLAYATIFLSLLHVAILDKTWIIYAVIVGVGFGIRIPVIKDNLIGFRKKRRITKV
ncbi:ferric reductase-like transmembrane domain-containing protein [Flavobacterium degerlachei]|jgi:sulfoxide reductase heme-binding subunit YedZ|uniref:Sulfoxide reductase heme-binding subunit YedZ n=1 Tax=Flavobacterium degerlachei TaxID=229203 RepID=A0A1H3EU24_9FLAO|nr:ferric reductase-like transmembrane domain-containing protein [Flavobacterium degerlachei]SDX82282.1 sulfoxide reductase heme-binding subunit YedZ [Flavobacterium degerlachei]